MEDVVTIVLHLIKNMISIHEQEYLEVYMNERIQKFFLEVQKSVQFLANSEESKHRIVMERFAELIVRECEQVSQKNSHRNDDMGAIIAKQIKKHFGVES